ncbi:MAG: TonB C-terminal domain-containing protein [Candidatus Pacebacteria bacterium]|nr:TonB C-terminal domain-containing protein [Candidatus Paceibacterota bacterium]
MFATRRHTTFWVMVGHAAVILVVLGLGFLRAFFQPPADVISVSLVQEQPVSPQPSAPAPDASSDPVPDPPPPTPPEGVQSEPAQTPETTRAKEPRNTWKPRSADDIRKTAFLSPVTSTPRTPPARHVSASDIAKRLGQNVENLSVAITAADSDRQVANQSAARRYLGLISRILHKRWQQPSRSETGSTRPTVDAMLIIGRDGRVRQNKLLRPSGNSPMDESVRKVLAAVPQFPPFDRFGIEGSSLRVDICFELD